MLTRIHFNIYENNVKLPYSPLKILEDCNIKIFLSLLNANNYKT